MLNLQVTEGKSVKNLQNMAIFWYLKWVICIFSKFPFGFDFKFNYSDKYECNGGQNYENLIWEHFSLLDAVLDRRVLWLNLKQDYYHLLGYNHRFDWIIWVKVLVYVWASSGLLLNMTLNRHMQSPWVTPCQEKTETPAR